MYEETKKKHEDDKARAVAEKEAEIHAAIERLTAAKPSLALNVGRMMAPFEADRENWKADGYSISAENSSIDADIEALRDALPLVRAGQYVKNLELRLTTQPFVRISVTFQYIKGKRCTISPSVITKHVAWIDVYYDKVKQVYVEPVPPNKWGSHSIKVDPSGYLLHLATYDAYLESSPPASQDWSSDYGEIALRTFTWMAKELPTVATATANVRKCYRVRAAFIFGVVIACASVAIAVALGVAR